MSAADKFDAPFDEAEAARRLNVSKATLARERLSGRIHPMRIGQRVIRYTQEILDEYRRSCPDDVETIVAKAAARKVTLVREPGIYFLYRGAEFVYVGKTTNFSSRLASHMFRKAFDGYSFLAAPLERLDELETRLVSALRPPLNIALTGRPTVRRTGYVGR
jgi:hypothetical protein